MASTLSASTSTFAGKRVVQVRWKSGKEDAGSFRDVKGAATRGERSEGRKPPPTESAGLEWELTRACDGAAEWECARSGGPKHARGGGGREGAWSSSEQSSETRPWRIQVEKTPRKLTRMGLQRRRAAAFQALRKEEASFLQDRGHGLQGQARR